MAEKVRAGDEGGQRDRKNQTDQYLSSDRWIFALTFQRPLDRFPFSYRILRRTTHDFCAPGYPPRSRKPEGMGLLVEEPAP
jgi:hypothetical protein